jgi:hypothetical protein
MLGFALLKRQVTPGALCRGTRPPHWLRNALAPLCRETRPPHWLLYAGEPVHPPGTLRERLRRTAVPLP